MTQPISAPIWQAVPLIKNFQYSYRLLALIVFFISAIAGIVSTTVKRSLILGIFCVVTMLYTILNWGNRGTLPHINDALLLENLRHGPSLTGWFEPTAPIWVNVDDTELLVRPDAPARIASGSASFRVISHNAIEHVYEVDADTPSLLRDNTFYFPGWVAHIDGIPVTLLYETKQYSGVLHVPVPQGKHQVMVSFIDSPLRAIAGKVSLVAGGVFLVLAARTCMRKIKTTRQTRT